VRSDEPEQSDQAQPVPVKLTATMSVDQSAIPAWVRPGGARLRVGAHLRAQRLEVHVRPVLCQLPLMHAEDIDELPEGIPSWLSSTGELHVVSGCEGLPGSQERPGQE
jgi:hypothetical protein